MEKKVLFSFVLLLLILANCNNDDKIANDLEELKLNGKVQSIRELSFEAIEKFGEIVKGNRGKPANQYSNYFFKFNDKGNRIEENRYKPDGSLGTGYTSGMIKRVIK